MKLIGAIAFLVLISVGCQKEDIRPKHTCPSANELRSTGDPVIEDVIDETDESDSGGITDPNDANRSVRTPKPKPN